MNGPAPAKKSRPAKTSSRRQKSRGVKQTGNGQVVSSRPAQTGRPKKSKRKDPPELLVQKVAQATRFIMTHAGTAELEHMRMQLKAGNDDVVMEIWDIDQRLDSKASRIFGMKYANRRQEVATMIVLEYDRQEAVKTEQQFKTGARRRRSPKLEYVDRRSQIRQQRKAA